MSGSARTAIVGLVTLISGLAAGCFDQRVPPVESPSAGPAAAVERHTGSAAAQAAAKPIDERDLGPFELKPEWNGPCERANVVDVNLGHAPEVFVRAANCQIAGKEPSKELVASFVDKLKTKPKVRRIDVVFELCKENGRSCELSYSDPWQKNPDLLGAPAVRGGARHHVMDECEGLVHTKITR